MSSPSILSFGAHYNSFGRRDPTEGIPEHRNFGGKRYRRLGVDTSRQAALDEAETRRAWGDRARVVKCSGGRWAIYVRAS